jgi:hypothetical protein
MVITYFNIKSIAIPEFKNDSELVIDPDAKAPFQISPERLKAIAGYNGPLFSDNSLRW